MFAFNYGKQQRHISTGASIALENWNSTVNHEISDARL